MMRRCCLEVAAIALASFSALAQSGAGKTISAAEVHRRESALADDSMEGRLTGSPGGARAARYIANQMQAIGLLPKGDSGYSARAGGRQQ